MRLNCWVYLQSFIIFVFGFIDSIFVSHSSGSCQAAAATRGRRGRPAVQDGRSGQAAPDGRVPVQQRRQVRMHLLHSKRPLRPGAPQEAGRQVSILSFLLEENDTGKTFISVLSEKALKPIPCDHMPPVLQGLRLNKIEPDTFFQTSSSF